MITVRPMQPNDLPAIEGLMAQLTAAVESAHTSSQSQMATVLANMDAHPEMYLTLVAEEDGIVLGMLALVFYRVWFHPGGTALITELVVDERQRGKGVGAKLIAAAVETARARGMDEIEVGTERQNQGAQRFYRRCGFDEEYVLLGMEFE
ncbi:GNAT family N-acetyltransferase [bacterium]|nr:MAG: GNAT family N-acetyltransferase [bacterium]